MEKFDWRLTPHVALGLQYQLKDDPVTLTSNFADYPSATFDVHGADPVFKVTLASLELTAKFGPDLLVSLDFAASFSDEQNAQLLSGGLSWKF